MGPLVPDKCVKVDNPSLDRSREIPPEVVGGSIFDCFPSITSDGKQTMMSYPVRLSTMLVWMYVPVKFGDSRSNDFPDI